jgi:hypothetical protein
MLNLLLAVILTAMVLVPCFAARQIGSRELKVEVIG